MKKNKLNDYRKAQLNTAQPGQRVIMVYDGIVRQLDIAIEACGDGLETISPENIETIHNSLTVAEELILELQAALDTEQGGDMATQLDGIYNFWRDHLTQANMEKKPERIQEVREMAAEMRETWQNAVNQAKNTGNT